VSRGWRLDAFDTRFGRAGILICEDAWHASTAAVLALKGADILYIRPRAPYATPSARSPPTPAAGKTPPRASPPSTASTC
jgi:predicted amidohydrolase